MHCCCFALLSVVFVSYGKCCDSHTECYQYVQLIVQDLAGCDCGICVVCVRVCDWYRGSCHALIETVG